jgi:hypothetical protein
MLPAFFYFGYFWDRVSLFALVILEIVFHFLPGWPGLQSSYFMLHTIPGMTGMYHRSQIFFHWDGVFQIVLHRLIWIHNPPFFGLLSSLDCKHEPLASNVAKVSKQTSSWGRNGVVLSESWVWQSVSTHCLLLLWGGVFKASGHKSDHILYILLNLKGCPSVDSNSSPWVPRGGRRILQILPWSGPDPVGKNTKGPRLRSLQTGGMGDCLSPCLNSDQVRAGGGAEKLDRGRQAAALQYRKLSSGRL